MAVKTITIDMHAYELLASQKQNNESFSQVIKRKLRPGHTDADLLANLSKVTLDSDTLDRLEEVVARRKQSPAKSPILD